MVVVKASPTAGEAAIERNRFDNESTSSRMSQRQRYSSPPSASQVSNCEKLVRVIAVVPFSAGAPGRLEER